MPKKIKKGGFFSDIDNSAEEIEVEEKVAELSVKKPKNGKLSVRNAVIAVALVIALAVGLAVYLIPSDSILPPDDNGGGNNAPYKPILFIEDWEAKIFEEEAYLAKTPDRIEYKDGPNSRILFADTIGKEDDGLVFLNKYLYTIKCGDHEAVNAMYTKKCLEREDVDGNKLHKKHDAFPMQRIFNISVKKVYEYEYKEDGDDELKFKYDVYYYVVRYNILRNDGLFRDDIDHEYSRPVMIKVLIEKSTDKGMIDMVVPLNGYTDDL